MIDADPRNLAAVLLDLAGLHPSARIERNGVGNFAVRDGGTYIGYVETMVTPTFEYFDEEDDHRV